MNISAAIKSEKTSISKIGMMTATVPKRVKMPGMITKIISSQSIQSTTLKIPRGHFFQNSEPKPQIKNSARIDSPTFGRVSIR